jgi:acid phosphatase (class A)
MPMLKYKSQHSRRAFVRADALLLVFVICAGFSAGAQPAIPGYIGKSSFDVSSVLTPAPQPESDRYEADRRIFASTRSLQGSQRWSMAINDVQTRPDDMARDFSCAAGRPLSSRLTPHLIALMTRAAADTGAETGIAKRHFKRLRPFQIDPGPICQAESDLADSYDYPSGHTTLGWTWATILAELLPDRATAILARGRAYGESRVVCGAHNASAVEAGRLSAAATLSVVRASPAYQADFRAVRRELNASRHSQSLAEQQQCKDEAALVSEDIFAPPSTGATP